MLRNLALILALLFAPVARGELWKGLDNEPLTFGLIDASDGSAVTSGTVSVYLTPNGGTQASATNSAVHEGNGQWSIDLTAAEWDADTIGVLVTETGSVPVQFTVTTTAPPLNSIYVDAADGSDSNDGLTPNKAKATIGSAITAAAAGDFTIFIAAGDYTEAATLDLPDGTIIRGADDLLTRIAGTPDTTAEGLFNCVGDAEISDVAITVTQGNCIQTPIAGSAGRQVIERNYLFGDDDVIAIYSPASGRHETIIRNNVLNCATWDGISFVAANAHGVIEDNVFLGSHFAIYSLMSTQTLTLDVARNKANLTTTTGDQAFIKIVQTGLADATINAADNFVTCYSANATALYLDNGPSGSIVFNDAGGNAIDWSSATFDTNMRVDIYPARTNALVEAGQVGTDATAILADTNELQTDDVPTLIAALPTAAEVNTAVEAGQVGADAATAAALNVLAAADIRAAVGLASANLDTQLGALPTAAEVNTAVEAGQLGTDAAAILVDTGTTLPAQITGLSTAASPQLLQSTTIATLASQTSFTLTAGSADDDAYNGATVIVTDQSTSTQKAVGTVSDYTGSSKTVTLQSDPGVFTMAAGDSVAVLSSSGSAVSTADADLIAARVVAARGSYYPPRQLVWILQRGSTGITVRDSLVIAKDKDETLKVWIDFAGLLGRNEAVETINSLTVSGGTATKVSSSEGITGNLVYLKVTGGADEDAVTVTYDVTTTEDQVIEGSVSMVIVDP